MSDYSTSIETDVTYYPRRIILCFAISIKLIRHFMEDRSTGTLTLLL
jgi:hypothetical protein